MSNSLPPSDDELTPAERDLFAKVRREVAVTPAFESRLLQSLSRQGLVKRTGSYRDTRALWWFGLVAATIGAVLLGVQVGRGWSEPGLEEATFAFFLYEDADFQPETVSNYAERYDAYNEWVARLRRSDQFITGLDFENDGVVIDANTLLSDSMPAAGSGAIGSMFLVTAESYDQAVELARAIPHLAYGGRVAIRRIVPIVAPDDFGRF